MDPRGSQEGGPPGKAPAVGLPDLGLGLCLNQDPTTSPAHTACPGHPTPLSHRAADTDLMGWTRGQEEGAGGHHAANRPGHDPLPFWEG